MDKVQHKMIYINFPKKMGNIKLRGLAIFNLIITTRKNIEGSQVTLDIGEIYCNLKNRKEDYYGLEVYY